MLIKNNDLSEFIVNNKDAVRRLMRLICDGRDTCESCPIRRECNKYLADNNPHNANFEDVEKLFINLVK